MKDLTEKLQVRLQQLHTLAPGSIGDQLRLELVESDAEAGVYTMRCQTQQWMRNIAGTLHGGMCATLVDQAMGCVAFCAKPGEGIAPTIEMNVTYHRPLIPGEDALIRVRLESAGKHLIHLAAEAFSAKSPDKLCLASTAVYYFKPTQEGSASE